ncbi:hypothetical protein TNCV_4869181 [Trichonephila clavipes]|nr:hypothetical protein TNCV_4869181 [Trichonephila clavipes]
MGGPGKTLLSPFTGLEGVNAIKSQVIYVRKLKNYVSDAAYWSCHGVVESRDRDLLPLQTHHKGADIRYVCRGSKSSRLRGAKIKRFGLAIHQNNYQARRRFVEWAQNEIAVVPDFHKRILFSDEAHFWLNGYVNKQNCRIWSEANPQLYVETPLHPEKLTVWCALLAGGIFLQKQ